MKIQDESSRPKSGSSTLESQGEASEGASMPGVNGEVSWLGLFEVLGWDEV